MADMYATAVLDSLDDSLMHFGVIGMHWGIRRYQPYGEGGYDPDHKGKEIGLAARLAGRTGSYSDAIRKGSSAGARVAGAAKSFGKKAGRAVNEGLDRLNYANDRLGENLKKAGKRAKKGLADYASAYVLPGGKKVSIDEDRAYMDRYDTKSLMGLAAKTLARNTKTRVSDLKSMTRDDVMSQLGKGRSAFEDMVARTKMNGKEFARSAALASTLLGGAAGARMELAGRHEYNAPRTDSAYRTRGLEDLGARKAPIGGSSYSSRDAIRKAMGTSNPGAKGLYDLGDLVSIPMGQDKGGERIRYQDQHDTAFKNRREGATSYFGSTSLGGPAGWKGDRGDLALENARRVMLSKMETKHPERQAFNADDMDAARRTISNIIESNNRDERIRVSKPAYGMNPYQYRDLFGKK